MELKICELNVKKVLSLVIIICLCSFYFPCINVFAEFDPAVDMPQVSAGFYHVLMLQNDGTVKAWGINQYGQLGLGHEVDTYTPTDVPNLTGVKQISANGYSSYALMEDGTVKAWGINQYGQLGFGDTKNRNVPTTIPTLSDVKQVAAGGYFAFALMNDGTVKAWGYNSNGELGIGKLGQQSLPQIIPGLTNVKQLYAGKYHTFAILNDGTVKAWGLNSNGQLGIAVDDTTSRNAPTVVSGLSNVKQLAVDTGNFSLALMNDGTVKAWGVNSSGQLGFGDTTRRTAPEVVTSLTGVEQLEIGDAFSIALMQDGTVKMWGSNTYGQFGTGTTTSSSVPVASPYFIGAKQIVAGLNYTIAIMNDGTLKASGSNGYGQLGLGDYSDRKTPTDVPMISLFDTLELARTHDSSSLPLGGDISKYFIMPDGTLKVWGGNSYGQLGLGDKTRRNEPILIPGLSGVKQVSSSYDCEYMVVLMDDGTVKTCGRNNYGQLGLGHTVDKLNLETVPNLANVVQVATRYDCTFALLSDGRVKAWGNNSSGRLGISGTETLSVPTEIPNLTGVKQLAVGENKILALMNDKTVRVWESGVPTTIQGLNNVKQIAETKYNLFALMEDGKVKSWGDRESWYDGALGFSTSESYVTTPTVIPGLENVQQLATGEFHVVALLNNGTVKGWGYNDYGQLGLGDTDTRVVPTEVPYLNNVKQICAGGRNSYVLLSDGTIKGWGKNNSYEFGILNDNTNKLKPTTIPGIYHGIGLPSIDIRPSIENAIINNPETPFTTSILVGDVANNNLTCKVYIDSEAAPKSTKTVSNTSTMQRVTFDPIDISSLTEGNHIIKYEVSNNSNTATRTATIYINKSAPTFDNTDITSTENYIKVKSRVSDTTGLHVQSYRYNVNGTYGTWVQDGYPNNNWVTDNYSTEGNSGRKLVRLDNGCFVMAIHDSKTAGQYRIVLFESNDNYAWRSICYIKGTGSIQDKFAITSVGNSVTVVAKDGANGGAVKSWTVNIPSQANVEIYSSTGKVIETGRGNIDNACSVTAGKDGTLYAAWSSRGTTDPTDSMTIRYSKSTDGGKTWSQPIDAANACTAGKTDINPCIVTLKDNSPYIVYQSNTSNTSYNLTGVKINNANNSSTVSTTITRRTNYQTPCESPCAVVDNNGILHIVWQNKDINTPNAFNILYNKSSDGINWTTDPVKITSEAQNNQIQPTITFDKNNNIYILWTGVISNTNTYYQLRKTSCINGVWGTSISNLTGYTTGSIKGVSAIANYNNFTDPLYVYQNIPALSVYFRGTNLDSNFYVKDLLTANTEYPVKIDARDKYGKFISVSQSVYTKAVIPAISLSNITVTTADISVTDSNPSYTEYQITDGENYILDTGELTTIPTWITLTNKKITLKGLAGGTVYNFQAKARNLENIETDMSNVINFETKIDKVTGVNAVAGSSKIKLMWKPVSGAAKYEIQADGAQTLISITGAELYIHQGLTQNTTHTYKVRGVTATGQIGAWSDVVTKSTITPVQMTCPVNYPVDKVFNLSLKASNVEDFDVMKFTVTYNASELEVLDLCAMTLNNDLTIGDIPNTNIKVNTFTPGSITFVVTKQYVEGRSWYGVVNRIKFKSKTNNSSVVTYKVE